ncbi:hypothetical protein [Roseicella sp. DB1501]|uniref:hypothetical protein n=1 Tax=Roseicella sp. DB1501 TaxID=2730925 RepID=UPI0014928189|nr:hypothetical protein [Roseicella sp. DB1501]NOG73725.1 hypothetical protein [Roseicella sp. DB1501]
MTTIANEFNHDSSAEMRQAERRLAKALGQRFAENARAEWQGMRERDPDGMRSQTEDDEAILIEECREIFVDLVNVTSSVVKQAITDDGSTDYPLGMSFFSKHRDTLTTCWFGRIQQAIIDVAESGHMPMHCHVMLGILGLAYEEYYRRPRAVMVAPRA